MRTSTLLAVLAALMLLVACAAPVFGQSSSSSTGESSSSSSAATIIASSSSSTGSSTNNNTVASSSSSSTGGNSNNNNFAFFLVFPGYTTAALNAQSNATTVIQQEISALLGGVGTVLVGNGAATGSFADYPTGGTFISVAVSQAASNALTLIENGKGSQAFISQANVVSTSDRPGSASTLSFGFAAVAVVLAALLQ